MTCDNELHSYVIAARAGDVDAFSRLIEASKRTVTSIALAIVKDIDGSEEVAQEVFIHIWRKLKALRNPRSFLPWARQITRYRAFNYLRDNKFHLRVGGEEAEHLLEQFASNGEPAKDFLKEEQKLLLHHFVDRLPEESREIVLLYYREDQSTAQVADLLGISEANVRKKLQRARESLKDQWLKKCGSLVLSTAPGVLFTSALTSALVGMSPPAAAAGSVIGITKASGPLTKGFLFLGGAMLGALAGVAGLILGIQGAIKFAKTEGQKRQLVRLRNYGAIAILLFGVLFSASYELFSGALIPIATYLLFVVGILLFNARVYQIVFVGGMHWKAKMFCWLGTSLGLMAGFTGLILGLINGGRL